MSTAGKYSDSILVSFSFINNELPLAEINENPCSTEGGSEQLVFESGNRIISVLILCVSPMSTACKNGYRSAIKRAGRQHSGPFALLCPQFFLHDLTYRIAGNDIY